MEQSEKKYLKNGSYVVKSVLKIKKIDAHINDVDSDDSNSDVTLLKKNNSKN